MMSVGILLCLFRCWRGPSVFDRVAAFDAAVLQALGLLVIYSMMTGTAAYLEVLLVVGLLGFVGAISFAYYVGAEND
jgi:multisubunit Na+/H+ antiporter MnhF subunit